MSTNKLVVIVDDTEFERGILSKALSKKAGLTILEAKSGDECLEILKTQKIDLVLMDIMMPGISGLQTLQSIREKFNSVELPVIMITAKADVHDVVGALRMGANDYITKPVNFDIAVSRVTTHLKFSDTSREMARLQELAALHAMISTYNHEINNPLTIALGGLKRIAANRNDDLALKKTEEALWRVAEIVKKIRAITENQEVQYQPYAGSGKMIKVK